MNFWRRDFKAKPEKTRADVIMQKKRRKQDPQARGLSAVAIPRIGSRTIHQRNEDRHVLEGTEAVAVIEEQEHTVKLLNISSNGVMIGFDSVIEIGQLVRLAIDDCAPVTTEVRWVQNDRVGLEFTSETVILAEAGVQDFIIKTISRERSAANYKPNFKVGAEQRGVEKRHSLVWVGRLCRGEHNVTVRLRNISASGAMLSLSGPTDLAKGAVVHLTLDHVAQVPAKVRWVFDNEIGIEFRERFDVSALIAISCAELAPEEEASAEAEDELAAEDDASLPPEDDFNSLRVRLANRGDGDRKPVTGYSKLSLDEVYDALHADQANSDLESEDPNSGETDD